MVNVILVQSSVKLAVPLVCLRFVIEVFPDHTLILFFIDLLRSALIIC